MAKSILLRESTAEVPVRKGSRWRVVMARPGQGSSGYYSPEVLKEFGPNAIAPGAQSFINHDDQRNPKDLIGIFPEGAYWDEDENALVGDLQVFSHWSEFVTEVAPHTGMSLYARGEIDEDGNVTSLIEDRLNGVDLVSRPGLIGSGIAEQLYESAHNFVAETDKPDDRTAQENEKEKMEKEILEALVALTEKFDTFITEQASKSADAETIEEAREATAVAVAAVNDADLLPSQRESLLAAAVRGEDVAPLIESAAKITAEARESLTPKDEDRVLGRFLGEGATGNATELGKVFG